MASRVNGAAYLRDASRFRSLSLKTREISRPDIDAICISGPRGAGFELNCANLAEMFDLHPMKSSRELATFATSVETVRCMQMKAQPSDLNPMAVNSAFKQIKSELASRRQVAVK